MPEIRINSELNNDGTIRGMKQMENAVKSLKGTVEQTDKALKSSVAGYTQAISNGTSAMRAHENAVKRAAKQAENMKDSFTKGGTSKALQNVDKQIQKTEAEIKKLNEQRDKLNFDNVDTKGAQKLLDLEKKAEEIRARMNTYNAQKKEVGEKYRGRSGTAILQDADFQKAFNGLRDAEKELEAVQNQINAVRSSIVTVNVDSLTASIANAERRLQSLRDERDALMSAPANGSMVPIDAETIRAVSTEQTLLVESIQDGTEALNEEYQALIRNAAASEQAFDDTQFEFDDDGAIEEVESLSDAYEMLGKSKKNAGTVFGITEEEFMQLERASATLEGVYRDDNSARPLVPNPMGMTEYKEEEQEVLTISESIKRCIEQIESEYQNQLRKIGDVESALQGMRDTTETVKESVAETAQTEGFKWVTSREEYQEVLNQIEKVTEARDKYYEKQAQMEYDGVDKESEKWKRNVLAIRQANAELHELNDEKKRMEEGGIEPEKEERAQQRSRKIDMSFMDEYMKKWQKMVTLSGMLKNGFATALAPILHPIQAADRALGFLVQKAGQVVSSLARMAGHAALRFLSNLASTATNAAIKLAQLAGNAVISGLQRIAVGAKNAAINLAKIAGGAVLGALSKLASAARNTAAAVARIGGSAVKKAINSLTTLAARGTKAILGIGKSSRSANGGLKMSLKTILKYAFGVRSMFFLFRRLRSAVTDGLGAIAKKNPELQKSLNGLSKAFNALKGSLATAFAPIVTAVTPALTTLINMLTSAINTIGAFLAALTGKTSYQKSIGAIGSSAKSSSKSVKDLNRQLASFDELNILSDKGNSGGGSGADGGGFAYETAAIESGIIDFVDELKKLWEKADFEGIGRIIADGINKAIAKARDAISWKTLGDKITSVVNGITGVINGLIDGVDWNNIGATFGEGINTIVNTWNKLFDGIKFVNLGKGLAEALNGLVDTVDWDGVGKAFTKKINAIFDTLFGLVTNFKWGDAGKAFGTAVSSFANNINWTVIGWTLSEGIKGALEFLTKAVINFDWDSLTKNLQNGIRAIDWDGIGEKFAEFANSIFDINWYEIGNTIRMAIDGILDMLISAVENFQWGDAGSAFVKTIKGLYSKDTFNKLATLLSGGINGAIDAMTAIVDGFEWGDIGTDFANAVNKLKNEVDWTALGKTMGKLLDAAIAILKHAAKTFEWEDAGKKFGNLVNALKNQVSWTDLGNSLKALLNGSLAMMRSTLATIEWGDSGKKFAEALNAFFDPEDGSSVWEDATATISEMARSLVDFTDKFIVTANWEQIGTGIQNGFRNVPWREIGKSVWGMMEDAFRATGSFLSALTGEKKTVDVNLNYGAWKTEQLKKQAGNVAKSTQSIWNDVADNLTNGFNNAIKALTSFIENLPVSNTVTALADWLVRVREGIKWDNLGILFGTGIKKALEGIGGILAKWADGAKAIGENIGTFLNNAIKKVDWFSDSDGSVKMIIQNFFKGAVGMVRGFFDNLDVEALAINLRQTLLGVDWKGIAQDIWDALSSALSKMGDFISVLLGGKAEVDMSYGEWKNAQYSKQSGNNSLAGSVSKLAVNILDAIKYAINNIPWKAIGDEVHDFLVAIEWKDIAQAFWDAFTSLLGGLGDFVNRLLGIDTDDDKKGDKQTSGGSSVITGALTVGGTIAAVKTLPKIAKSAVKTLFNLKDTAGGATSVTGKIGELIGNGLKTAGKKVGQFVVDIAKKTAPVISDSAKSAAKGFVEYLPSFLDYVGTGLQIFAPANIVASAVKFLEDKEIEAWTNEIEDTRETINNAADAIDDADMKNLAKSTNDMADALENVRDPGAAIDALSNLNVKDLEGKVDSKTLKRLEQFQKNNELDLGETTELLKDIYDEAKQYIESGGKSSQTTSKTEVYGQWKTNQYLNGQQSVEVNIDTVPDGDKSGNTSKNKLSKAMDGTPVDTSVTYDGSQPGRGSFVPKKNLEKGMEGSKTTINVDAQPNVSGGASYKNNGLLNWLKAVFAPGVDTQSRVALVRENWKTIYDWIQNYMGGAVTKGVGVERSKFQTIASWIIGSFMGGAVTKGIGVERLSFTTIAQWILGSFMGGNVTKGIGVSSLFGTIASWIQNGYMGGAVSKGVGLSSLFGTVATWIQNGFMGGNVNKGIGATSLFGTIATWITNGFMGGSVSKGIGVIRSGFTTIAAWILATFMGGNVSKDIGVSRSGFTTIASWILASFMGGNVSKGIGVSSLFGTIASWIQNGYMGGTVSKGINATSLFGTIASWIQTWFMGGDVSKGIGLMRDGFETVAGWIKYLYMGGTISQLVELAKDGWDWVDSWVKKYAETPVTQDVKLSVSNWDTFQKSIKSTLHAWFPSLFAEGGIITAGGNVLRFANGGIIMRNGKSSWWDSATKYASGTSRAHGTVFVAGENGPEIMGHVNGRTEILNKSQLAQAIYGAVVSGMGAAVNALGKYLANHMSTCANAIVSTISANSGLAALNGLQYYAPAMASGGIVPYAVSEQIAKSTEAIQSTLNANNEDLIQTIISVAGQLVSAVSGLQNRQMPGNTINAQQVINEINRQYMMGLNPIKGV